MFQVCEDCNRRYDDEYSNTMCPHYPLGTSERTYCREHDLFKPCSGCAVQEEFGFREGQGKSGAWTLGAVLVIAALWALVLWWWSPWNLTIPVLYDCVDCGTTNAEVRVPARKAETDVREWMEATTVLLMRDHSQRSPRCRATKFTTVKIPVTGAEHIGGAPVN